MWYIIEWGEVYRNDNFYENIFISCLDIVRFKNLGIDVELFGKF